VVANADRAPDGGGFYNHQLSVTWSGVDATSGIASCTSLPYAGPDGTSIAITGTCKDKAGNISAPVPFVFGYDSTPPGLANVAARSDNASVRLSWDASGASRIVVMRSSGGARVAQSQVVYDGAGDHFTDTGLKNGTRYSYLVQAFDAAGNVASTTVAVTPYVEASSEHLLSPGHRSRVRKAPMLRWREIRKASYYNVQLFRKGKKILSAWPTKEHYQLHRVWTYRGQRHRLVKGTYWWYLWAGYGHRSQHRYGKLLGRRSFIVR
ncbi:MAG TPA: fibronectin type III domain-containing protein, partial [Solirubrobacteraceae bacterium]